MYRNVTRVRSCSIYTHAHNTRKHTYTRTRLRTPPVLTRPSFPPSLPSPFKFWIFVYTYTLVRNALSRGNPSTRSSRSLAYRSCEDTLSQDARTLRVSSKAPLYQTQHPSEVYIDRTRMGWTTMLSRWYTCNRREISYWASTARRDRRSTFEWLPRTRSRYFWNG